MPLRTWFGRRVAAARGRSDEGAAMLTAILMMLILAALTVTVLGLVLAESMPTQQARKNTRTVYAAEAGIQATLSQLRSAQGAPDLTGTVYGSLAKLPCALTGSVSDASGTLKYAVSMRYYRSNPAGRAESWLASNAMTCTAGTGTTVQPTYAEITSSGTDASGAGLGAGSGNRKMISIYRFQTTNTNVKGGNIYTFGDAFCLQATGTTAGKNVKYVDKAQCGQEANQDIELWLYDTDYEIKLASSTLPGNTPLCITGPTTAPTAAGTPATLQTCKTDASRWPQLWSWEGGAHWRGENSAISNYSNAYLAGQHAPTSVAAGDLLYVSTNIGQNYPWGSFDPDPAVGAGAASYDTHQIVNYLEFGRCFDVTGEDPNAAFEIVYPCKQDPSGGQYLNWNHKWYYTEPTGGASSVANQQISVLYLNSTSSKYCLVSPETDGGFVYLTSACNAAATNQSFTRFTDTGDYSTSYTFKDNAGLCIGLSPTKLDGSWTEMNVSNCTGGPDQKWNAPPDSVKASIGNYREVTGG